MSQIIIMFFFLFSAHIRMLAAEAWG